MKQNLKIATLLVVGTMTISTILAPQTAFAVQLNATQSQSRVNVNVDAISQYQQGLNAASTGDLANALDRFNRAISMNPQYFQAYIERGNVKDAIHDFAGAIADYTTAISLNPKSAHAFYNRGTVLSRSEKHQAAIADYQQAITIDPEYAQAHLNLANELDDLDDVAGALTNYNRAISLKPNYALAYLNRGIMHERAGNRAQAIADLRQAAKLFQLIGQVDRYNRAIKMIKDIQSEV
jgi:tetratricopeptide (TPR) repeat protein